MPTPGTPGALAKKGAPMRSILTVDTKVSMNDAQLIDLLSNGLERLQKAEQVAVMAKLFGRKYLDVMEYLRSRSRR